MDKKDIYEHLAKIYLDASSKRKKKSRNNLGFLKLLFFTTFTVVFASSIFFIARPQKNQSFNSEVMLALNSDAVKINFNFNPAKKEAYSLDLSGLDVSRFKALGFSVKKANIRNNVSLKVEFVSKFKEKSGVYFKNIANKWQDYEINLSEFKNISAWQDILSLSFVVEEWNTKEKSGVVYLDNIRLLE